MNRFGLIYCNLLIEPIQSFKLEVRFRNSAIFAEFRNFQKFRNSAILKIAQFRKILRKSRSRISTLVKFSKIIQFLVLLLFFVRWSDINVLINSRFSNFFWQFGNSFGIPQFSKTPQSAIPKIPQFSKIPQFRKILGKAHLYFKSVHRVQFIQLDLIGFNLFI